MFADFFLTEWGHLFYNMVMDYVYLTLWIPAINWLTHLTCWPIRLYFMLSWVVQ